MTCADAEDKAAEELAAALSDLSMAQPTETGLADSETKEPIQSTAKRRKLAGHWGNAVREVLQKEPRTIRATNTKIGGLALSVHGDEATIYCALQSGSLKVFNASTGAQVQTSISSEGKHDSNSSVISDACWKMYTLDPLLSIILLKIAPLPS